MASPKNKHIGLTGARRYDIPLNKGQSTGFLMVLIALMTFLALMALSGSIILKTMGERWTSGLENALTIEIPAQDSEDKTISLIKEVEALIKRSPSTETYEIMTETQVSELVSPWLGEDFSMEDIPLPTLLSVTLKPGQDKEIPGLKKTLTMIDKQITVDTHDQWLSDILKLTNTLQSAAAFITLIIGITTIIAIAGGVRARMAEHKGDVELLHMMGATDQYIASQFQRHTLILALKGALAGAIIGLIILFTFSEISGQTEETLLPAFNLKLSTTALLLALPIGVCAIAMMTARFTVLRSLRTMP